MRTTFTVHFKETSILTHFTMAGSGRVVVATKAAMAMPPPVPLSSKTKTNSSNRSSNKSIMTEEESLFDPFGIVSESNNSNNPKETSLFLFQQDQDEQEEENVVMDPFGYSSTKSPRGPPEVSRVTRPSGSRLTSTLTGGSPTSTLFSEETTNNNMMTTTRDSSNTNNNKTSSSSVPRSSNTFFGSRAAATTASNSSTGSSLRTIPPKLQVRMTKYEEVASHAYSDDVGVATVSVEGSLYVQVQGSDAMKNAPFCLIPSSLLSINNDNNNNNNNKFAIKPNTRYTTQAPAASAPGMTTNAFSQEQQLIVHVPKSEIGFVPVIHYSFQQTMAHLPVLLERKVTIHETSCRIALQVRSKLTNKGNLRDFCLAVAIPEHVDASTVEILRGNGTWDPLLRLIKFRLDHLPKGESFMVSAQAKLWKPHRPVEQVKESEEKVASGGGDRGMENGIAGSDPPIVFPVMLRCSSSEDQMSDVEFDAREAPGIPCSITSLKAHSFRLLHRLT